VILNLVVQSRLILREPAPYALYHEIAKYRRNLIKFQTEKNSNFYLDDRKRNRPKIGKLTVVALAVSVSRSGNLGLSCRLNVTR